MDQMGYSLVDGDGKELRWWGETPGTIAALPEYIVLPNGDQVHCPEVGLDYQGVKLVPRMNVEGANVSTSFDGEKIIITQPAPLPPPEFTPQEKLSALGLTVDDLKALLNLK